MFSGVAPGPSVVEIQSDFHRCSSHLLVALTSLPWAYLTTRYEGQGDFQKRCSQAPPAGGGEVGGSGAGRGTLARSVCLGFPPPTFLRHCVGAARFALPPAGGRPGAEIWHQEHQVGCSFAEIGQERCMLQGLCFRPKGKLLLSISREPLSCVLHSEREQAGTSEKP